MKIPKPDNGTYNSLINQGRTAAGQGKTDLACQFFMQAAGQVPSDTDRLAELARRLEAIQRFGKAHDLYARILQLDPGYTPVHSGLASLYLRMGNPKLAEEHCRKALVSQHDDPNLYFFLGKACAWQMKINEAMDAYTKFLQLGVRPTALFYGEYATVLEAANKLDELADLLETALEKYPDDALLNFLLAKYERRQGRMDAALERLQRLDTTGMDPDTLSRVFFETGRIQDSQQAVDEAFTSFEQANALQRKLYEQAGVNKDKFRQQIEAIRSFDPGKLASLAKHGSAAEAEPAFLIGFPRSGTTLLHQVLLSHPAIDVIEERPILFRLKQEITQRYGAYPEALVSLDENALDDLRSKYLEMSSGYISKDNPAVVINKMPLSMINLPLVYRLFPRARIITALRHPCDACLSCFMQYFTPNTAMANFFNLDDATRLYADVMGLYVNFRKALPLKYHTVHYEDVVENLETEARKLVAFLELEWDDSVLNYRQRAMSENIVNTPSYHQVVRPIYRDSMERWRRYEKYLAPYKERLEPYCKEFGYKF